VTVVFFISGHGFGHASRQVEVINRLGARRPDLRIIIRSAARADLLERTIRVPYEVRPGVCDTGIVQSTSVSHDDPATVRDAVDFYSQFDQRIEREFAAIARDRVRLIVSDIPPLGIEVARRLDRPSVAIGNFTWDWIYETHPGFLEAAEWVLPLIRKAYGNATLALELPFAGGFDVFPSVKPLPLIARHPTRSQAETRAHFNIPADRPAVLLSFGGYGMPSLDLSRIDCTDWIVVVTDRVLPSRGSSLPPQVVYLEERTFVDTGFRYEDLVRSVDVVMSKPGYGIVSECIACDTPLLYTSRGVFREYDVFVREMPRFLRCRFIHHADIFSGRWRTSLEAVVAQPAPPERLRTNGADEAARELEGLMEK
jgi:L-arabinokinase